MCSLGQSKSTLNYILNNILATIWVHIGGISLWEKTTEIDIGLQEEEKPKSEGEREGSPAPQL